MKKKIIIIFGAIAFIALAIIVSYILKSSSNKNIIKEFGIEEGCYSNAEDSENLMCFTKQSNYYSVLNLGVSYFNDINFHTPPKNDELYGKYNFEFKYEEDKFTLKMTSSDYSFTKNCSANNSTTIKCVEINSDGSEEEKIYQKIEKEFNEETISKLPIWERTKEYKIDFAGEIITCNLTWQYSIIRSAVGPSTIKSCLEKEYNKKYTVSEVDNKWIIWSEEQSAEAEKTFGNSSDGYKYLLANYSYEASVEGKSFSAFSDFSINPYSINETMIVNITSTKPDKDKEYGLYQLQINKKYISDIGISYKFIDSKTGIRGYFEEHVGTSSYETDNFTYERKGNQIFMTNDDPRPSSDPICTLISDKLMTCSHFGYSKDYAIK